jgi:hemoglobin
MSPPIPKLARLALALACTAFAAPALQAQPAAPAAAVDDSLFVALGGQAGVRRIVDDFVPRLVADARMSEFFKKSNQAHLRQMLAEQFCQVAGGGCAYTGLPMDKAHQDMDIAKSDFNALVEVLQAAMDAQGVPFATQNRLLARLAPMHRDIVSLH